MQDNTKKITDLSKIILLSSIFALVGCFDKANEANNDKATEATNEGNNPVDPPTKNSELTPAEITNLVKAATVKIKATGSMTLPGSEEIVGNWTGSGFFIDASGYIVTNNHVATGAGLLKAQVEGLDYNASVVGLAECADLAVLKLSSGSGFPVLEWYEGAPEINLEVAAAGFPGDVLNSKYTSTQGIINTEAQLTDTYWASATAFYHSALLSNGSSGGPLVERGNGTLVGVNYARGEQRNLAISGTVAKDLVTRMINGENIYSIGISGETVVSPDDQPLGIWVRSVQAGGKASTIGIKPGDIIRKVAGVPLYLVNNDSPEQISIKKTMGQYCSVLRSNNPNNPTDADDKGKTFDIEILRSSNGKEWNCVGEINGKKLGLKDDPTLDDTSRVCPIIPPDAPSDDNTGGGQIPNILEEEPNNNAQLAQNITLPSIVTGSAKHDTDESDLTITFENNSQVFIEDVFTFTLTATANLNITLTTHNQADFDLYVADGGASNIIATSNSTGTDDELMAGVFNAGTYFIYIDAYDDVTSPINYSLSITIQ